MSYQLPEKELAFNLGKLFKYRSVENTEKLVRALQVIRYHSLWFWHLTGQNDEYECSPVVFWGGSRHDKYKYFVKDFKHAYPNEDVEK